MKERGGGEGERERGRREREGGDLQVGVCGTLWVHV